MYTEVEEMVSKHFEKQLSMGSTINEVVNNLKSGSLPWELRKLDVPISEIRRIGQHISTRYILKQAREQSARIDLDM